MTDQPPLPVSRARWALAVAIVALAAVALGLLTTTDANQARSDALGETPAMVAVAPGGTIELAALPADHQALYRAAAADPEAFAAVACHCGCEEFLDHRHLLDCFVRGDGGWERHATGCAVCLAEARDVVQLRSARTPIEEIARHIDDRYGATATPT